MEPLKSKSKEVMYPKLSKSTHTVRECYPQTALVYHQNQRNSSIPELVPDSAGVSRLPSARHLSEDTLNLWSVVFLHS
jgi:hypothetical protein